MAERPTPAGSYKRLVEHKPTVFYGVPTLYAGDAGGAPRCRPRDAGAAHEHLGRRGAAGRSRQALAGALRTDISTGSARPR